MEIALAILITWVEFLAHDPWGRVLAAFILAMILAALLSRWPSVESIRRRIRKARNILDR